MVQLGLVGCAHIHTPGFIRILKGRTDVKVKSVWDHTPARGVARAEELSAGFVVDEKSIFTDPEITAVIVCTETDRHEQVVGPAAAAKKHLFVEKPLGFANRDANLMADAIEKAGVIFQTGYFMRGNPINQFVKEQIGKGNFGKITRARASNCHSGALGGWFDKEWRWMADPKIAGCGAFGDLGTHSLDILLWMLGDVDSVTATMDHGTARYPGCDETGEALIKFKNGAIATLAAAWDDVANPVTLMVSGTEGHAIAVNGELFFQSKHVEGADGKTPWHWLPTELPHAFELFLDAVCGKTVPLVGVREAAYRNAVMGGMYDAAKKKSWVTIK